MFKYSLDNDKIHSGDNYCTMDFIMWNSMVKWEEWKMRNGASFEALKRSSVHVKW